MSRHVASVRLGQHTVQVRPELVRRWRPAGFGAQVWVLTVRSLRGGLGDRRMLLLGLLQPIVLLLLFSQVFQAVGTLPGVVEYDGYINFLMPATMVNIALAAAMATGTGLLTEVYTGFVGRLRAMPVNLSAVLLARTVTEAVRLAGQLLVAVLAGVLLLGFRPGAPAGLVAAVALTVFAGWGLGWLFVAMATWQRKPQVVQAMSFIVMFPLMFSSSAYLPVTAMPGWLQVISKVNPLTYAVDAVRALALGRPPGPALVTALALVTAAALLGIAVATSNFHRNQ